LDPQHFTVPFANNAHECTSPAEIAVAFVRPLTTAGVDAWLNVPFPNCPSPFKPQHLAVPFANNAHECEAPAEIAIAVVRPLTTTGVEESENVPFPNWPSKFQPQHLAVPFANNPHECVPPAEIAARTAREPARGATAPAGASWNTSPVQSDTTATAMHAVRNRGIAVPPHRQE
jgi:hypothetical protein